MPHMANLPWIHTYVVILLSMMYLLMSQSWTMKNKFNKKNYTTNLKSNKKWQW